MNRQIACDCNKAVVVDNDNCVRNLTQLLPYLSQALGIVPYTAIGFLGSRFFAFRDRRGTQPVPDQANEVTATKKANLLKHMIDLSIVVPCYNEEAVLPETIQQLTELLQHLIDKGKSTSDSCVYYVDDGSRDRTWDLIETFAKTNSFVRGIKLSRNRGHQNALLAGLLTVKGEAVISIDADLQDDLSAIEEMLDEPLGGFQGQASDVDIHAKEILRMREELDSILVKHTQQPLDRIRTDTERDFFMSGQQAQEYGIIDEVILKAARLAGIEGKPSGKGGKR